MGEQYDQNKQKQGQGGITDQTRADGDARTQNERDQADLQGSGQTQNPGGAGQTGSPGMTETPGMTGGLSRPGMTSDDKGKFTKPDVGSPTGSANVKEPENQDR